MDTKKKSLPKKIWSKSQNKMNFPTKVDIDYLFDNFDSFCSIEFSSKMKTKKTPRITKNLSRVFEKVAKEKPSPAQQKAKSLEPCSKNPKIDFQKQKRKAKIRRVKTKESMNPVVKIGSKNESKRLLSKTRQPKKIKRKFRMNIKEMNSLSRSNPKSVTMVSKRARIIKNFSRPKEKSQKKKLNVSRFLQKGRMRNLVKIAYGSSSGNIMMKKLNSSVNYKKELNDSKRLRSRSKSKHSHSKSKSKSKKKRISKNLINKNKILLNIKSKMMEKTRKPGEMTMKSSKLSKKKIWKNFSEKFKNLILSGSTRLPTTSRINSVKRSPNSFLETDFKTRSIVLNNNEKLKKYSKESSGKVQRTRIKRKFNKSLVAKRLFNNTKKNKNFYYLVNGAQGKNKNNTSSFYFNTKMEDSKGNSFAHNNFESFIENLKTTNIPANRNTRRKKSLKKSFRRKTSRNIWNLSNRRDISMTSRIFPEILKMKRKNNRKKKARSRNEVS